MHGTVLTYVPTNTSDANTICRTTNYSPNHLYCCIMELAGREVVDVPADGLCFWHCIAASRLLPEWMAQTNQEKVAIAKQLIKKCEKYVDDDRIAPWFESGFTPKNQTLNGISKPSNLVSFATSSALSFCLFQGILFEKQLC